MTGGCYTLDQGVSYFAQKNLRQNSRDILPLYIKHTQKALKQLYMPFRPYLFFHFMGIKDFAQYFGGHPFEFMILSPTTLILAPLFIYFKLVVFGLAIMYTHRDKLTISLMKFKN